MVLIFQKDREVKEVASTKKDEVATEVRYKRGHSYKPWGAG